jgi:predicted membrane protein
MVTTQDPTPMNGEQTRTHASLYAALLAFALFMLVAVGSYAAFQRQGGSAALDRDDNHDIFVVTPGKHTRDANGKIEMAAFFHNSQYASHATGLRHAEVVAIVGHSTLDLTDAQLAASGGTIEAVALCGRTDIKVPPDWTVKSKDYTVLGAVNNAGPDGVSVQEKVVRLEAVAIMGAVNVSH